MDVPDYRQEVPVVEDSMSPVSALEEMPDASMATVETPGVCGQNGESNARERLRAGPDSEVEVVGHQAVSKNVELKPRVASIHRREKSVPVFIVSKDRLSLVSPRDHVVDGAREVNSQGPRHSSDRFQVS